MIRLSTALRNRWLGLAVSYTGSFGADASGSKFTDAASGFLTAGFRPGDVIYVSLSGNTGFYTVQQVSAGELVVAESVNTASATSGTISVVNGKTFKQLLKYGKIDIYSGSQPASADSAETGTKLASITLDAGSFTAGSSTNGLLLADPANGIISKDAGQSWRGFGIANGTAGWFRFYDNGYITGADTSNVSPRFDGSVGLTGADLVLSNVSITVGGIVEITTFELTLPASV